MQSKTKEKHIHKFKLHKFNSGNSVFFCALPDCSKKLKPALCLGKECICWRCGNSFILTEYALRLVKPHCEDCHKPKDKTGGLQRTVVPDFKAILPPANLGGEAAITLSLADKLKRITQPEDEEL